MSEFHDLLAAVHGEVWEAGAAPTPTLEARLGALAATAPPDGVVRLPTAHMHGGPHLAPQADRGWAPLATLEERRAGAAARRRSG